MCSMKHANGLLRVMHAALVPGPMYGPEGIRVAPRRAAKAGGLPWQAAVAAAVWRCKPLWLFRQLCFKI